MVTTRLTELPQEAPTPAGDLVPLAWVLGEVRESVQVGTKAFERVAEATSGPLAAPGPIDSAPLRLAQQRFHQVAGVLVLVQRPIAARFALGLETVARRFALRSSGCTQAEAAAVRQAGFALIEFLEDQLGDQPRSPVGLFPQYRQIQELAEVDRIHPADLWDEPWRWLEPAGLELPAPLAPDEALRERFDRGTLQLLQRASAAAAGDLRACSLGLAAAAESGRKPIFWQLAAGFYEALEHGLLPVDLYAKRAASRILLQYVALARGESTLSDRLAADLLFFCALAHPNGAGDTPALEAIRSAWSLDRHDLGSYQQPIFGLYNPDLLTQARKRITAVKASWSDLTGGDATRLDATVEQLGAVADSLRALYERGEPLADELNAIGQKIAQSRQPPNAELAMEAATALLFLEASFAEFHPEDPTFASRLQRLADRLDTVRKGARAPSFEPWMEELYRRVSEKQTMGSVIDELRVTLATVEQHLDQFFRHPDDRSLLDPVPALLSETHGVLSVLGLDQAALAVSRIRGQVDRLRDDKEALDSEQLTALFQQFGNNFGTLGFLIDTLSYQPVLARKLFIYDETKGELTYVAGREPAASPDDGAADAPAEAEAQAEGPATVIPEPTAPAGEFERLAMRAALEERPALAQAANRAAAAARAQDGEVLDQAVRDLHSAGKAPAMAGAAAEQTEEDEDDRELIHIFLDEGRTVVADGQRALEALEAQPADMERLTDLRRAFHTLKGSARMVGLAEFSAAAWALEDVLNAHLAQEQAPDAHQRQWCGAALSALGDWLEAIRADHATGWSAAPFEALAARLRDGGSVAGIVLAPAAPAAQPSGGAATTLPAGHDDAADTIELAVAQATQVPEMASLPDLDLDLTEVGDSGKSGLQGEIPPEADTLDAEAHVSTAAFDDEPPGDAETTQAPSPDFGPADEAVGKPAEVGVLDAVPAPAPAPSAARPAVAAAVLATPVIHQADIETLLPDLELSMMADLDTRPRGEDASSGGDETLAPAPGPTPAEPARRRIGELELSEALYAAFLDETEKWSSRLVAEMAAWTPGAGAPEQATFCAHSLAGSSGTVGFVGLAALARSVEHALRRMSEPAGADARQIEVLVSAADEIRAVLHQFAAGILQQPDPAIQAAVDALQPSLPATLLPDSRPEADGDAPRVSLAGHLGTPEPAAPTRFPAATARGIGLGPADSVDPDLFPIFEEEAAELLPQLSASLRQWMDRPDDAEAPVQVRRVLHTLKGSARLVGALTLGDMAHQAESAIEAMGSDGVVAADIELLMTRVDAIEEAFQRLRDVATAAKTQGGALGRLTTLLPQVEDDAAVDSRVDGIIGPAPLRLVSAPGAAQQTVRVRSELLDRLLARASEVTSSRARLDSDLTQMRGALGELARSIERLRRHLRDVELQVETQIPSRLLSADEKKNAFDPLEFDRFTRAQELTRMMAESVDDVATVQHSLRRVVESSEDDLAAQARQSYELQHDLLRTRMVDFDSVSERLHRVVRLAAIESGKHARLEIIGGDIEIDRGVLERMVPSFEHLLRNCVVHGIEDSALRLERHKDGTGLIRLDVQQSGNDVSIEFRDDGGGLALERIRERAVQRGLIAADHKVTDAELARMIFKSGFTTTDHVTELAGRGVGMDVVQADVQALGGRIDVNTQAGRGTSFKLTLPVTTALTNVVMIRAGDAVFGVPSGLVENIRRTSAEELERAYATGTFTFNDEELPFFWAGALLQDSPRGHADAESTTNPVVIFRSAAQRVAVHVDEMLGNQEVVVKALGPQLSQLPGLVAITVLTSGTVTLIYNPVALVTVYGARIRALSAAPGDAEPAEAAVSRPPVVAVHSDIPLILVVDDSITVRRVMQRLLRREGYRVALAADGEQGLEQLRAERPAVVLSDIEMPRMDGFELLRAIRADESLAELPVVMITSRAAEKHREHAFQLGANHYLGKPYSENELLGLIRGYVRAAAPA